ncbi:hypothetical protein Pelo_9269 [Pelomyxa schiedti]|nr:hypothetical protein Pelo_9269 [Pelomyxa schiedti]
MQMKPERRRQEKYREGNQGYGNNNSHRTAPTSSASSHTDLHQDLSRQALCVTGTAAKGVSPVPTTSVLSNFESRPYVLQHRRFVWRASRRGTKPRSFVGTCDAIAIANANAATVYSASSRQRRSRPNSETHQREDYFRT